MTGLLVASKDDSSLLRPVIIRGGAEANLDGTGNHAGTRDSDWTRTYGESQAPLQGTWLYDRA